MRKAISVIAGGIAGYLLYYYLIMELVTMFFYSREHETAYRIICYVTLLATICICCIVAMGVLTREISPWLIKLIYVCYFLVLCYALFYRRPLEQVFIWNPLDSIRQLSEPEMLFESILNVVIFIPMGVLLRKWKLKNVIAFSCILSFSIELYQGVSRRGYFDTFDSILYLTGIAAGYFIMQKLPNVLPSKKS